MPPVFLPFLLGIVVAPLVKRIAKPLVRGTIKTSVGLAAEMRKAAHEVGEGFHDITAEVTTEMISAELRDGEKAKAKVEKS